MRRKSAVPWLIAAMTFGPFVVAWLLYFGPFGTSWLPSLPGERELVEPPLALPPALSAEVLVAPQAEQAPVWALIYARTTPCDAACDEDLRRLLAVELALGRDVTRVRRVYLHLDAPPALPAESGVTVVALDAARDADWLRALGTERLRDGRVYIADPLGNVVVGYPPSVEQKELLRDLKRLLNLSQIG